MARLQNQVRRVIGYALVDASDKLVIFDARAPIYWHRAVAGEDNAARCNSEARIVRVVIEEFKTSRQK